MAAQANMRHLKRLIRTDSVSVVLACLFLKEPPLIVFETSTPQPLAARFVPDPLNFPLLFNTLEARIALQLADFCQLEQCSRLHARCCDLGGSRSDMEELPLSRHEVLDSLLPPPILRPLARFISSASNVLRLSRPQYFSSSPRSTRPSATASRVEETIFDNLSEETMELLGSALDSPSDTPLDELAQLISALEQKYVHVVYQYSRRDFLDALTLKLFKTGGIIVNQLDEVEDMPDGGKLIKIGSNEFECAESLEINIEPSLKWLYYDCFVVPVECAVLVQDCDNSVYISENRKILCRRATGRHADRGCATIEVWGVIRTSAADLEEYFSKVLTIHAESHFEYAKAKNTIYEEKFPNDLFRAVNSILQHLGEAMFATDDDLLNAVRLLSVESPSP